MKLRNKKLTSLSNHIEEIWAQGSGSNLSSNPLQSLLNNIRRGQVNYYYGDRDNQRTNLASTSSHKKSTK